MKFGRPYGLYLQRAILVPMFRVFPQNIKDERVGIAEALRENLLDFLFSIRFRGHVTDMSAITPSMSRANCSEFTPNN